MADKKTAYDYFLEALSDYPELPDVSDSTTSKEPQSSAYDNLLASLSDFPELPDPTYSQSQGLFDTVIENMQDTQTVGGATGTLLDSIARPVATATQAIKDGITNIFSSDVETGSRYDLSDNEQAIYSIGQNVGRWGITGALAYGSAMTGGLASVGLGALSKASLVADTVAGSREVYKGIYEDALGRGLSEADASNSAAWGTAMSMPFEFIGDAYMAKVFGKANAKRIEKKLIAAGAAERAEQGNAIKVLDKEVAEGILQEEVAGNKKLAGLLPAPAEKEVTEGAADEVSDFISLRELKDKLPISETVEKIKGKIPTAEEWEAIKSKIKDADILEKIKDKIPTAEEWEAIKSKIKNTEILETLKGKVPTKEEWASFVDKIKGKVPTKEEWEALKDTLKDNEWINKVKGKVPTKEEWEALATNLKNKVPSKQEWSSLLDNTIYNQKVLNSINKTKQFAKDTASTIASKKAEFIAARKAAQKAQLHIKDPELYRKILKEAEAGRNWRELAESVATEMATEGVQGRFENLGTYMHDPNMTLSEVFEGTAQDMLLGGIGAGVLHGIAKGIGKSPIGKFSSRRIAEMHRRRFDLGTTEDKASGLQDDFYNSHIVIDSDTKKPVAWEDVQDDKEYDLLYAPTTSDFIQAEYSRRGQSKSDRALSAEEEHQFSIKDWNKDNFAKALESSFRYDPINYTIGDYYALPENVKNKLRTFVKDNKVSYLKDNFLSYAGWHHTGKNLRQTTYYKLDLDALLSAIGREDLRQQLPFSVFTSNIPIEEKNQQAQVLENTWKELRNNYELSISKNIPAVAKKLSGTQAKKYAEKVVKLRVDPETKSVVIPADIEFKDAPGTLTVSEDGTTTITPDYSSLSDDPVKAEEQAVEQTEQTRAAIMRDEGVSEKDVNRQSPMPGAANRETFGKLSEGSEIQNDVTDKPDIVEEKDDETVSDFIARKIDKEAEEIVSNYKNNKPQKGLVSKNHVLSTIAKFAKKALDINLDTTLKTEGRFSNGRPVAPDEQFQGQTDSISSIVRIRDASDGKVALHELGHYLFNRGRRLQFVGFGDFIGRNKKLTRKGFETEMQNVWKNILDPGTNPANENPATTTWDAWTTNKSDVNIPSYNPEQQPYEIFVETFARYVANQGNFREQFKKAAPATYKAFQQYLTERKLHDDIEKIRIVWDKYASQDARTRGAADSSNQRPTRYQKLYDYIQKFIGDRQHLASILSKTIDNLAGFRRMMKELGDRTYKASDRFERIRGQSLSAVQAFISGKGLRWGGSDLFGTRFRNYDSIISDVQKLKAITDSKGNTVTGVQRFDAYLAAKNTVGETVGNTKTMRNVEAMARDLGQTVRQTQADIIDIKRNANYDWNNSKYAPYRRFIEERVRSEGQWIQTQETLAQAWNIIEDEEKQADFDRLQKAFNDYQYLWNSVQNYVSAMSPSMEAYIKAMRIGGAAYYTPLMREILQNSEKYNAVITQREGSDRPAYSSLENTPAEISALIDAGLRAYTKDMLVKMADMPDSGVYIQEVTQPEKALNMVKIKEAIKEATLKTLPPGTQLPQDLLDALDLITVGTIYIADPEADLTGNVFSVVTVNSAGKADLRFFRADDALLTMLETHNDTDGTMNQVLELLDYFNRFQKDWFTRYSLRFVLYKNQFRDAFSASFKGNRLLFKTGNKYIDNNWLNSIAGSLQGMASTYMMWMTNPNQWEQYEDAMAAIGMSTNKIQNEYNAILSRTKPSVAVPQGAIGFLTSPKFKKFLQRMDQSDLIVRISELEYLLKDLGVDKEELYLSKDRVCALALSKNKLESIGLKYDMIEQILTNDQRTMWNNTNSAATLTLNLTPGQIQQIQHIVETSNVRTQRSLTEDQIDMLNREVALCTTDFLRHGKWSDKLNRYMLFSKAGINGTAQYGTWIDRRKMQGRSGEVYGRIVSAAISGWLLTALFGDDDEDEEEMWNGIRLRFGDATIDIPALPEDLLGWNMGRALAHGDVNGTFVKHFAASINPIKSAGFAGLVADVLSDKKLSRVGWDDFAEPIIPPYLKQKYGDELDKIVTYNTGIVARALPNIFGMTPAHWQYVLNNMGIGRLVKAVETAAGVDKSVLLPDGSVIPTGQGSLNYVVQQAGINRPLYRTRYERQLDELFKEATTEYSMSPDDEDAKAKYLLLYNATHLQQNLNKLRFYATTPDQQKRLVALTGATAKNSLEAITGGNADLYKLRAANKSAKAALETTQAQLKETGEGTPVENLQEAEKTVKVRRPKKEKKK